MKHATPSQAFNLKVEFSREEDGRWIADIPALPGVTVYGRTRKQVLASAEALAVRVIADRLEHGEALHWQDGSRNRQLTGCRCFLCYYLPRITNL